MKEALATIERLALLPKNWDTYGSCPIQEGAIQAAKDLLVIAEDLGMKEPNHVGPISGGALCVEWVFPPHDLEFETLPDGSTEYVVFELVGQSYEIRQASQSADETSVRKVMTTFLTA